MNVGILQFEILVPHAQSLKDKRSVVKSLKDRARREFNVAIAEVGDQDLWQRAKLGVVTVGTDSQAVHGTMTAFLGFVSRFRDSQLLDHQLEIL